MNIYTRQRWAAARREYIPNDDLSLLPSAGHRRSCNRLFFLKKNSWKKRPAFITPRSYCLSVQENDHLYHKLDRIASLDQNPLNLNHVHDQDQDNPCLVNVIPLLRLKCALLLTISLATVSFKLSMFLHLCAIIASTYSLLVTLLRRLPNVNFLLSTKLSLSYQKCTPHYVRTV